MKIRFLGATSTVTGSRTLVDHDGTRVLVDCGLFQGFKQHRLRNREPLEVEPSSLDAVVLTHAHLDHSGWLPALSRSGFAGPVYCTEGTAGLLKILLPDAGRIQEADAEHANRKGYSRHSPALPLYTVRDALRALRLLRPSPWVGEVGLGSLSVTFHRAGHILGAASVRVASDRTSVLFSGDIGRPADLVMLPPAPPVDADFLVVESTYGDRDHEDRDPMDRLAEVVQATVRRGGMVLIPSFAVGRAQSVLFALCRLRDAGRIPDIPLVLDSPMAVDTTNLYLRHLEELRLSAAEARQMLAGVQLVRQTDASKALHRRQGPFALVSSSGMLTGGRVLHHLRRRAVDPDNTLLFVGYQAAGTRGATLLSGEADVKIHGALVNVRCHVERLDGFSAHADRPELIGWMRQMATRPRQVFLNHGEPAACEGLRRAVREQLAWEAVVATEGREITLGGAFSGSRAAARPVVRAAVVSGGPDPRSSSSHLRADLDLELLARDDMRMVRLALEYQKVETALAAAGVEGLVVVFGSARADEPEPGSVATLDGLQRMASEARRFGRLAGEARQLGGRSIAVATGGGPGIMAAANRGATDAGLASVGFNIGLPHEQDPNPWITPSLSFQFRYFALRKLHFMQRARALVAFPGGYGTLDEVYEALCLVQTEKVDPMPIVLVGRAFWQRMLPADHLVTLGTISASDAALFEVVDGADEAWGVIERFYGARPHPRDG